MQQLEHYLRNLEGVGGGGKANVKTTLGQNVAEWPGKDSDGTKRCQIMANHLEG